MKVLIRSNLERQHQHAHTHARAHARARPHARTARTSTHKHARTSSKEILPARRRTTILPTRLAFLGSCSSTTRVSCASTKSKSTSSPPTPPPPPPPPPPAPPPPRVIHDTTSTSTPYWRWNSAASWSAVSFPARSAAENFLMRATCRDNQKTSNNRRVPSVRQAGRQSVSQSVSESVSASVSSGFSPYHQSPQQQHKCS
jgi:hypothetical protein